MNKSGRQHGHKGHWRNSVDHATYSHGVQLLKSMIFDQRFYLDTSGRAADVSVWSHCRHVLVYFQ